MGFSRQEYWSGVPLPSPDVAKVELLITTVEGTGEGVHFLVAPVDVAAERVFMRIKK